MSINPCIFHPINAPTNAPVTRADLQRKDEAAVKIQAITRSKHDRLNAHRAKALTEIQNRWECCVCACSSHVY